MKEHLRNSGCFVNKKKRIFLLHFPSFLENKVAERGRALNQEGVQNFSFAAKLKLCTP
jgi:hypothetical protein